ncbi:MAG: YbhB/YbcL family Raf kinase inhibitor-like protein [Halothiobacillaceae bacterium]|jgi:Raf kinase inhibitor-like YbhB/YbcL family protein|nr:YbhB/YbcL family Raf kinase inhibitor-like protein [Halothiobacillaceae bacterium]
MQKIALLGLSLLGATLPALGAEFTVSSPQIAPNATLANEQVFKGFGCEGDNISPQLLWKNAPEGTKSFAVTAYDPDAPTGSGWWHWVVFNIPADAIGLPKGAGNPEAGLLPKTVIQSRTDFGQPGYGGPCPPVGHGPHRYQFTVHALKVDSLPLDAQAPAAMVGFYLNQNSLGKATLEGLYTR